MKRWHFLAVLPVVAVLALAPAAFADEFQTYNLAWSGASFGDDASATGQITLDLSTLPNPSSGTVDIYSDIQSLTVTVTGSGSGDGTWTLADLNFTNWWTDGTLNMGIELVGQQTSGSPWGTPDTNGGDFNLFFNNDGPWGDSYFTMGPMHGGVDPMLLTDFSPASETPEPGTLLLFGTGLVGLAGMVRRKVGKRN